MRSANVYKQSSDVKGTCVHMAADVVLLESVQAGGFCAPVFQRLQSLSLGTAQVSKVNNSSFTAPVPIAKDETSCILLHGKYLRWRQIDACAVACLKFSQAK